MGGISGLGTLLLAKDMLLKDIMGLSRAIST